MSALKCFRMPTPVKISGRTSSVTNSFVNGVIPVVPPSEQDVQEALDVLGLTASALACAYCGDPATEWDHFRPIVTGQRPTGYISEIQNLVPACGKCNQSKGSSPWKDWMLGPAKRSPARRGVPEIVQRTARLERFEAWRQPTIIDFAAALGPELWNCYWAAHDYLLQAMRECEITATEVRTAIQRHINPIATM